MTLPRAQVLELLTDAEEMKEVEIDLASQKVNSIRSFEAARSERYPWLDGATTRVPRLFAAKDMPSTTPSHSLATPTPDEWRAEVRQRRAARKAAREAGQQQQQAQ